MCDTDRIGGQLVRRKLLQHAHYLQHGDAAGAGRRHAADFPLAVGCAYRIALFRAVLRQIMLAQVARIGALPTLLTMERAISPA